MPLLGIAPLREPVVDEQRLAQGSWNNWFSLAFIILFDQQNSGTTAQRPTTNLYVGKTYFDTSLSTKGKPIWIGKDGSTWVDAAGTAV